jgi:hypothetical protein
VKDDLTSGWGGLGEFYATLNDDEEQIGRIALSEDELVSLVAAAARDSDQELEILSGEALIQRQRGQ